MNDLETKQAIQSALAGFADQPLAAAATALFESLGYKSQKHITLKPNTAETFVATFAKEKPLNSATALLADWKSVDFLFQLTDDEVRAAAGGNQQFLFESKGKWNGAAMESYLFFAITLANPPYIPIESMAQKDKANYESRFPMLARKYDSSVVFILAVLDLLSRNGVLSYISSITWQTGENYGGVRKRLFTEAGVRLLVNLPFDVFKSAYVDTGIYLISQERSLGYLLHRFPKTETDFSLTNLPFESVPTELVQPPDFKVVLNLKAHSLLQKAKGRSVELGSISESTQGLAGNMFERANSTKSREIFPFVASGQVYRYVLEVTDTFPTDLSDKPSLKRYYETGGKDIDSARNQS